MDQSSKTKQKNLESFKKQLEENIVESFITWVEGKLIRQESKCSQSQMITGNMEESIVIYYRNTGRGCANISRKYLYIRQEAKDMKVYSKVPV